MWFLHHRIFVAGVVVAADVAFIAVGIVAKVVGVASVAVVTLNVVGAVIHVSLDQTCRQFMTLLRIEGNTR